jgi:hypothetical protein
MKRKKKQEGGKEEKPDLIHLRVPSELKKARKLAEEHSPNLAEMVPLRIDRNTVIYITKAKIEKNGLDYYKRKHGLID